MQNSGETSRGLKKSTTGSYHCRSGILLSKEIGPKKNWPLRCQNRTFGFRTFRPMLGKAKLRLSQRNRRPVKMVRGRRRNWSLLNPWNLLTVAKQQVDRGYSTATSATLSGYKQTSCLRSCQSRRRKLPRRQPSHLFSQWLWGGKSKKMVTKQTVH